MFLNSTVSGLGGSQMEARLNRTEVVHYICRKKSDWYQIWISLEQLEMFTECFVDNMRLDDDDNILRNSTLRKQHMNFRLLHSTSRATESGKLLRAFYLVKFRFKS